MPAAGPETSAGIVMFNENGTVPPVNIRPPRQHTVTKSVLKQFGDHDGRLLVFDKTRSECRFRTPGEGIFKVKFDSFDPIGSEQAWNRVETKFPRVFRALKSKTALDDPAAVETLRELLAIHWARSIAVMTARDALIPGIVEANKQKMLEERPDMLTRALVNDVGIIPSSTSALEWINDRTHDRVVRKHLAQWNSGRNLINYEQARQMFAESQVQIGYTCERDLIIGDCPVVTTIHGKGGVGPHQGIALGDADSIAMPVTPNILITLGQEATIVDIEPEAVDWYNERQWDGYQTWMACRPGGRAELGLRSAEALARM